MIEGQKKCSAWHWGEDGQTNLLPWPPRGLVSLEVCIRVGGVGTGCMLLQIDVIRTMLEKYKLPFASPNEIDKNGNIVDVSDDVYFGDLLSKEGIPVHLDTSVVCKHFGIGELGY